MFFMKVESLRFGSARAQRRRNNKIYKTSPSEAAANDKCRRSLVFYS